MCLVRRTIALLSAAALTATAALAATVTPAVAAPSDWTYSGASGATQINALGTAISSGLTAASDLAGSDVPASHVTAVAAVKVPNLATVGAITSGQAAEADGDGTKITSSVDIANINLLNGVIKADAIHTTSVASANSTGVDGSTATTFVHLTIGGALIPVDVGPNTKITVPGIATVVLNETSTAKFVPDASVRTQGMALHVTLLKARAGAPAGAEIKLNPTVAAIVPSASSTALQVGGFAYGLFAGANVGSAVKVFVQPTGVLSVPPSGTNGLTATSNVAAVKLPNLATLGVVTNSINALTIPGFSEVTDRSETAKVNLLNGLITADAIQVSAHVLKTGPFDSHDATTNFVNLTIAGKKIPINVAPNTTINVLGIAKIIINQQVTASGYSQVIGLRIILSTAKFGLPIGADVQVAVANASIDE
ncbi:MAG: hypothetical protein JWP74_144 [Marmoricola sp.]|nr:hypothetical protein [Marmoricola sp.]